uniref:Uncharacterized protein n=1 Tax=Hyaloperonospora arabidopsidis (strain Emoy2) TaxID=559515 RepID=M4BJ46_HYAAE
MAARNNRPNHNLYTASLMMSLKTNTYHYHPAIKDNSQMWAASRCTTWIPTRKMEMRNLCSATSHHVI